MANKSKVTLKATRSSSHNHSDLHISSSFSQGSENFIFLVLDCYSYIAGEKVTGEILFNVTEPIGKCGLRFYSRGTEEISIFSQRDRSSALIEEVHDIYSVDVKMREWEDGLEPGQYVFPFNFKLPSYCPSTFYYSGEDSIGNYIKAQVFYHLSIKLLVPGEETKLSHSRIIIIKNSTALDKPGPYIEATANISGCCFSNKGHTNFKLSIGNTDHCQVDGEVKYKLVPNNEHCRAPINYVVGNVVMDLTVFTTKGEFKLTRKISEANRNTWISAFTSMIYEKDFEYISDLKVNSEELNPCSNKSAAIVCEYFIEILVFYDIAFVNRPITIRLPFHVNPKITYRKEEPRLPILWEPEESSIFNFIVESNNTTFGYTHGEISQGMPSNIN